MKIEWATKTSVTSRLLNIRGPDSVERREGCYLTMTLAVPMDVAGALHVETLSPDDARRLARALYVAADELDAKTKSTSLVAKFRASHSAHVAESMERNEENRASAAPDATPTEKKS